MALADRKIETPGPTTKLDVLLAHLDDTSDRAWLEGHLLTVDGRGEYLTSAKVLSRELRAEGDAYAVSATAISDWRAKNPSP